MPGFVTGVDIFFKIALAAIAAYVSYQFGAFKQQNDDIKLAGRSGLCQGGPHCSCRCHPRIALFCAETYPQGILRLGNDLRR